MTQGREEQMHVKEIDKKKENKNARHKINMMLKINKKMQDIK